MFEIAKFYEGKSVFITGGTGFLGKILVYKLLKSCPDLASIYLLIRPKKGVEPRERLETLFSDPAFDELRERNLLSKLYAVEGDVTMPGLGLSEENEAEIVRRVSVIFHSAATVNFDEDLSKSIAMNVGGTKYIMDLAKKLKDLSVLVHVSTAYCNCNNPDITEAFYPLNADPKLILEEASLPGAAATMDTLENTRAMIKDRPNTYTFTKALAEKLVQERGKGMPVAIVRPSIVVAALDEPQPGWIDNLNGPTGIFVGAGMGLMRTFLAKRECKADFIPVDTVINTLCAVGAKVGSEGTATSDIPIYNCTSGSKNPVTWGFWESKVLYLIREYPLEDAKFYPDGSFKRTILAERITQILLHFIPGYFIDFLTLLSGGKPMLVKLFRRMKKATDALEYFSSHEWNWTNDNVDELSKLMTKSDSIDFNFDVNRVEWSEFLRNYVLGVRHHLMKNKPESVKECRVKLEQLRIRDMAIRCVLFFFFTMLMLVFVI